MAHIVSAGIVKLAPAGLSVGLSANCVGLGMNLFFGSRYLPVDEKRPLVSCESDIFSYYWSGWGDGPAACPRWIPRFARHPSGAPAASKPARRFVARRCELPAPASRIQISGVN